MLVSNITVYLFIYLFFWLQKQLDDIPVVTEFVQAAAKRRKQAMFPEKYREQEF